MRVSAFGTWACLFRISLHRSADRSDGDDNTHSLWIVGCRFGLDIRVSKATLCTDAPYRATQLTSTHVTSRLPLEFDSSRLCRTSTTLSANPNAGPTEPRSGGSAPFRTSTRLPRGCEGYVARPPPYTNASHQAPQRMPSRAYAPGGVGRAWGCTAGGTRSSSGG